MKRDNEADPAARHELNNIYTKHLRAFKRKKAQHACTQATMQLSLPSPLKKCAAMSGRVFALRDPADPAQIYDTPEDIGKHAYETYSELFRDPSGEQIPDWIFQRWSWKDLADFRDIDGAFMKDIIMGMTTGKTCSSDLVVAEMLQQLDDDVLDCVANIMNLRLINHQSEDTEQAWNEQVLNLVKKKARVN